MRKQLNFVFTFFLLTLLQTGSALATPEKPAYMGTASCASSNCHGSNTPRNTSSVLQNEYVTWSKRDKHSQAWVNLTTAAAKKMAAHLGIKSPEQEPWCLRCHSTYVEGTSRLKPEFKIEDGVGCESCHGAAEGYINEHAAAENSHSKNVGLGLNDLVPLTNRAELCVGCHIGSEQSSVTHRLIGSGHPRLSFELDTFSMLQPKHWMVDEDYTKRKAVYNSARAWLVGQVAVAQATVQAFASPQRSTNGRLPEFSLLACYSCHHSLGQEQWKVREYAGHPGELRLNTSALFIVKQALQVTDSALASTLEHQISDLHSAFREGTLNQVAPAIESTIRAAKESFLQHPLSKDDIRQLLKAITRTGATAPQLQYEFAEQVAMAISSLLAELTADGKLYKNEVDQLYKSLRSAADFRAEEFTKACNELLAAI